jgi:Ca2+-transporting ATPase
VEWDELTPEERTMLILQERGEASSEENSESEIYAHAERIPRTIAFTVLALGQIFHVSAIHAGERVSFFRTWFSKNRFMLWAVLSTVVLQLLVVYVPFLQITFETYPIRLAEMLGTVAIASITLFAVELEKIMLNRRHPVVPATA